MTTAVVTKTTAPSAAPTWRNRIVGSGEEAPDQLLANPANWRIHPKAQQDALAGAQEMPATALVRPSRTTTAAEARAYLEELPMLWGRPRMPGALQGESTTWRAPG